MGLIFFIVQDKIYGDLLLQDCVHGLCWRAESGNRTHNNANMQHRPRRETWRMQPASTDRYVLVRAEPFRKEEEGRASHEKFSLQYTCRARTGSRTAMYCTHLYCTRLLYYREY